ncbi:MAG: nucleotidyltransferase domain-containing protein [Bacteroidota bacterium]
MDKETAIRISKDYIEKVKNNNIVYSQAWMFGSWAKGIGRNDSDIDLAIVLPGNLNNFDLEVKLMTLRTGEETMIEPHPINLDDFNQSNPFTQQIITGGFRIDM